MTKWCATVAALLTLGCLVPSKSSETSLRSAPSAPASASPSTDASSDSPPPADHARASTRGLAAEDVRRAVFEHLGAFNRCFDQATAPGNTRKGGLLVAFTIAPEGHVTRASIAESNLNAPHVTDCVLAVFRSIRFPSADKPTNASFPFALRERR